MKLKNKIRLRAWPLLVLIGILSGPLALHVNAQEEGSAAVDEPPVQVQKQASKPGVRITGGSKFEIKDGKLMVTNADGTVSEMDFPAVRGITVKQSSQTVVENGEQKTVKRGRAILIGPDGKRQEFDLSGDGEPLEIFDKELPGMFQFKMAPSNLKMKPNQSSKFMIGGHCVPTSKALQSQLELAEGTGLTVTSIVPGSPSEKAGFKVHDILMYAGDKEMSSTADLNKAVESAGKDDEPIMVTTIRAGKEMSIEVKPIERPAAQGLAGGDGGLRADFRIPGMDFEMEEIGPGIIIGRPDIPNLDDLQKGLDLRMKTQLEHMNQQMKEMREMQDRMNEQMRRAMGDK